jgi:hypothetical protein
LDGASPGELRRCRRGCGRVAGGWGPLRNGRSFSRDDFCGRRGSAPCQCSSQVRVDGGGYGGLWHKGTAGLGPENNGELTRVENTERERELGGAAACSSPCGDLRAGSRSPQQEREKRSAAVLRGGLGRGVERSEVSERPGGAFYSEGRLG